MIRAVSEPDIPNCAEVIRESFKTVADELGFTPENAPTLHRLCRHRGAPAIPA